MLSLVYQAPDEKQCWATRSTVPQVSGNLQAAPRHRRCSDDTFSKAADTKALKVIVEA
jgi:hypothetical protein